VVLQTVTKLNQNTFRQQLWRISVVREPFQGQLPEPHSTAQPL
ncbi:MAG: hypothetical protein ACI932_002159, partial [Paracoccaceae bacterium]